MALKIKSQLNVYPSYNVDILTGVLTVNANAVLQISLDDLDDTVTDAEIAKAMANAVKSKVDEALDNALGQAKALKKARAA